MSGEYYRVFCCNACAVKKSNDESNETFQRRLPFSLVQHAVSSDLKHRTWKHKYFAKHIFVERPKNAIINPPPPKKKLKRFSCMDQLKFEIASRVRTIAISYLLKQLHRHIPGGRINLLQFYSFTSFARSTAGQMPPALVPFYTEETKCEVI
jgi:hypothetical protein